MAKGQKYYVVWQGYSPGIYTSWNECLSQVKSYPNAKYKAFGTLKEAEDAYLGGYSFAVSSNKKTSPLVDWQKWVPKGSIAVDAACSGNPGLLEYRGVDPYDRFEFFHVGPLQNGTNNLGEFLAIVHGLAILVKKGDSASVICSDSKTALSWVKLKRVNTKLVFDKSNLPLKNLVDRALYWLQQNSYTNKIIKWETELWGEIPADFGRK